MSEQEYKCPCCGADIGLDSELGQVKCDSCGNTFEPEALKEHNAESFQESSCFSWRKYEGAGNIEEGFLFSECKACGGQFAAGKKSPVVKCPLCDAPLAACEAPLPLRRPDVVLPFSKDKDDAKKAFTSFFKKRLLLPSGFMAESRIEQIKGIYVPFWIFDCGAEGKARFDGEKEKRWSDKEYKYTRTERFMVVRGGKADFELIPIQATTALDKSYVKAIEPFDPTKGIDPKRAKLGEYPVLISDAGVETAKPDAEEIVRTTMEGLLRDSVSGYGSVRRLSRQVSVSGGTLTFGLFPVWILSTKYKNRIYRFVMNAQTGKFIGELPLSRMKLLLMFLAVALGITLVGAVVTLLFF